MYFKSLIGTLALYSILFVPAAAWASHPLITDDSGTQGKGRTQIEVNGQYDSDKETVSGVSVKSTGGQAATTLSYGITTNVDLVLSLPYVVWSRVKEGVVTISDEKGISDANFEAKWRFFEKDGLSFAVKPGVSFPTGDENKGLGAGKTGYHVFLIGSEEAAPWGFHANLGYIRNGNKADERKDLWHASLAATYDVAEGLKLVGNAGLEQNPDSAADNDPAFFIAGIIYSVNDNFDLDAGIKAGLTSSETDLSLMAGASFRF